MTDIVELIRVWDGEDIRDIAALFETLREDPAVSNSDFYSLFYETARKFPGMNDGIVYDHLGKFLAIGDSMGLLFIGNVEKSNEITSFQTLNPENGEEV